MERKKILALLVIAGMLGTIFIGGALGQQGSPVKIGVIEPLTGSCAYDGIMVKRGIVMAEKEINNEGGILGRPLELIIEDGKADPAESVSAAEKLIVKDEVCAIEGAWASSATLAIMPVVGRYGVPLMVETSTSQKITKPGVWNKWVFRICPTAILNSEVYKMWLENEGIETLATIVVNNDWGRGEDEWVTNPLEEMGGKVTSHHYAPHGEVDFYSYLTTIESENPDGLFICIDVQSTATALKQVEEIAMDQKILLGGGLPWDKLVELAGKKATNGVFSIRFWDPGMGVDPKGDKEFVEKYKKQYPGEGIPDKYTQQGYDGLMILADAIERAGSVDREKIRIALKDTKYESLRGTMEFDEYNQAHPYIYIAQIREGELYFCYGGTPHPHP